MTHFLSFMIFYNLSNHFCKCICQLWNISLGETSLMYAAVNKHLEVVKLLLEHNADVQAKENVYG